MAAKTLLCIGIGGFAGLECPGPGASIARALRAGANQPLRIVASGVDGVLANAWLPGVADSLRTVPDAVQDPDGFADAILRLARTDRIVAYLPGSTAEVLALARRHGSAFGMAHLAVPLPSWDTARRLTRVGQLQFLQELGIPTPPCQLARGVAELRLVADQIGYPAVILGKTSGAALANNRKEAEI